MDNNENIAVEEHNYYVADDMDVESQALFAAKKHYSNGRFNDALKVFEGLINSGANAELYNDMGACYYQLGKTQEAIEYLEKAITLNSNNIQAYTYIGNLYFREENYEKAISYWLVAQIIKPEDEILNLNLATAYYTKDMMYEAITYYEKYLKYAQNKTSEEYTKIKENLDKCKDSAQKLTTQGDRFYSNNDIQMAKTCYSKAIENYPNATKATIMLARIYLNQKDFDNALKYFHVARKLDTLDTELISNIALCYDVMNKYSYAYCYYTKLRNRMIHNQAEYYRLTKRINILKNQIDSKQIEIHYTNAQNYASDNNFLDAIEEFENYSILHPQSDAQELVKKLKSYVYPENNVIKKSMETGNQLMQVKNFKSAAKSFARVLILADTKSADYNMAKSKFQQCSRVL